MRPRVRMYIDIKLDKNRIEKLNKGKVVHASVKGQMFAISVRQPKPVNPLLAKIESLESQLRELRKQAPDSKRTVPEHTRKVWAANAAKARAAKMAKYAAQGAKPWTMTT